MTQIPPPPPPEPPGYGYQVPPSFGAPGPHQGGTPAYDPLVPEPFGGLRPLWDRLTGVFSTTGKTLLGIFFLTFALPQIAQAVVVELMFEGVDVATGGFIRPDMSEEALADPELFFAAVGGLILVSLLLSVVVMFFQVFGWCAAIWAVTQHAAGQPVTVPDALRAAGRRVMPMFGWYLLVVLLVIVGLILCVLPGLYFIAALSLFSFAVMYERGTNPIGRSFQLVHREFGAVLGRVGLVVLFVLGVSCVVGACMGTLTVGVAGGLDGTGAAPPAGMSIAANSIAALVNAPVYAVVLVALLLTYTQVRARQEPVSTGMLQAAVSEAVGGPPGYPPPTHPGHRPQPW